VVAAFAVPGAVVWAAIGAALGALPAHGVARWAAVAYAAAFGIAELAGLGWRAPTSTWQVPSTWVRSRRSGTRTVIWGALLGPGLVTRNPYASIWMLPLLLAGVSDPLAGAAAGAVVGALQGGARAVGVVREVRTAHDEGFFGMVIRDMRWRRVDGAALLAAAAAVAIGAV
jgi:hypothetical protein